MNNSINNKSELSFNSQLIINYKISTTCISKIELDLIKNILPENIEIIELTPCTDYLITPKIKYNEKILAALDWKIPIIGIEWLYNINDNINNYLLKPFQDMKFTFLESLKNKNEEIRIKNFFELQGAIFQTKITICTNFIIINSNKVEDIIIKYKIPLIPIKLVYLNRFHLFKQIETLDILNEKIERKFFIDSLLPKQLYNTIKKHIIKLNAKRVSDIKEADFILTNNFSNYNKKKYNCLNYNYIFDCSENKRFLYTEKYKLNEIKQKELFKNFIFGIDSNINLINKEEIKNKIFSLSGTVLLLKTENINNKRIKLFNQKNITHIISNKEIGIINGIRFVNEDWLNSSLLELKIQREKILFTSINKEIKKENIITYVKPKILFFQFSGIINKTNCINKLNYLNYEYSDSNIFDNRCTHLIIDKPITSEKLTCAVINGLILIKSKWGENIEYELNDYKWKYNSKNTKLVNTIINAIKYWREQINLFNNKPFNNWIVKIEDEKLKEKFYKILEFGGAKFNNKDFTHEFVKKENLDKLSNKKDINFIFQTLFRIIK